MSTVHVDDLTKKQAEEYADQEGEIYGFNRTSPRWEKAFKEHLKFAYSTMSVGRNPRHLINPRGNELTYRNYPEIFGSDGFAGEVAKGYRARSGDVTENIETVRNRVMSAVSNLVKLFENGKLKMKTSPDFRKQGKITNEASSAFQFPPKEGMNEDEYKGEIKDVIFHHFVNDLVTNAVLESLKPFFNMSKSDIEEIMSKVKIEEGSPKELMTKGREAFVKELKRQADQEFSSISYKRSVLK